MNARSDTRPGARIRRPVCALAGLLTLLVAATAQAQPVCTAAARTTATAAASAPAASPSAVAEALLRAHFCAGFPFDATAVQVQSPWLADDLRTRLLDWLARPQPADEVPDLNGDPWTDAQETPTRYAVQPPTVRGARAEVPVTYWLAPRRWQVTMLMRRDGDGRWRVADLRYRQGDTLTQLLR